MIMVMVLEANSLNKALGKEREILKNGPILHIKNIARKCDNTDQWTSKALEIEGNGPGLAQV